MSLAALRRLVFEKFLGRESPTSPRDCPADKKPKRPGRPKLPDDQLKHPRKDPTRFSPKTGRLLPSKRKYKLKKVQWKKRRKAFKRAQAAKRKRTGMAWDRAYNASLRRKFIQARWIARQAAVKRGQNPDLWWTLTYDEWLVLWATSDDVLCPKRGLIKAAKAVGNPIKSGWRDVAWASRRDPTKPWGRSNVVVMWNGEPLPNKLNEI